MRRIWSSLGGRTRVRNSLRDKGCTSIEAAASEVVGRLLSSIPRFEPLESRILFSGLPFSDNFNRPDDPSIGTAWSGTAGIFELSSDQLVTDVPGSGWVSVANPNGVSEANVTVSADVNLNSANSVGLVARDDGTEMYVGRIRNTGGGYVAEIGINDSGSWTTTLAQQDIGSDSGTLTFEVVGNALGLYLDGSLVTSTHDGTITDAGSVGAYGVGNDAALDNFSADTVSFTPSTASLPFSDNFDRDNSPAVGEPWSNIEGNLVLNSDEILADVPNSSWVSAETLSGPSEADVTVSADVDATAGGSVGVIARESGGEMYVGRIRNTGGGYVAEIGINNNGSWTSTLDSEGVSGGTGTLTLTVIGNALTLYVGSSEVASATDSTLTGAGTVGVYIAGNGGTADNFSAAVASSGSGDTVTLPYSDNFNRADGSSVGDVWSGIAGNLVLSGDEVASDVPGSDWVSAAVLNGPSDADVTVSADINVTSGGAAGLVARESSGEMYVGRIRNTGSGYVAEIGINSSGTWTTTLDSESVSSGSGTLNFIVVGDAMGLYLNGGLVASTHDSTITAAGTVGIYAVNNAVTFDNFSADVVSFTSSTVSLPYSDNFNRDNSPLVGEAWSNIAGDMVLNADKAVSNVPASYYVSAAVLNGPSESDVTLSADIDVTADGAAGLAARETAGDMYVGRIRNTGSGYVAEIGINSSGTWTTLDEETVASGSGTLTFSVVGNALALYYGGELVASAHDSTLTSAGALGVYAVGTAVSLDNFSAAAVSFTPSDATLPFSDSFTRDDSPQVGEQWTEDAGDLVLSNDAVSSYGGPETVSLAEVNGVSAADVTLSASVDISGTDPHGGAGLFARKSGDSMYAARLITQYHVLTQAEILKCVDGVWTTLTSVDLDNVPEQGTLRFELFGSSLKLYLNETLEATAYDSDITAAGAMGIYALDGNAKLDNFAAAAIAAPTAADASLPFTDNFNENGTSILGADWTKDSGDLTVSNDQLVAPVDGDASAELNGISASDVVLSADVTVENPDTATAGLDARITSGGRYRGQISYYSASPHAEILKNVDGTWTTLDSRIVTGGDGTLRFEVVGSSLELYLNGRPVAQATDDSITGPGTVGVFLHNTGAAADNFSAAAASSSASPVSVDLPFTDNFNRDDSSSLGTSWAQSDGEFAVGQDALLSMQSGTAEATVNGISAADVSVSADVDASIGGSSTTVGLDARVSGSDAYRGQLRRSGGYIYAEILVDNSGTWTTLDSRPIGQTSGTLRFDVVGSLLGLYLNNALVASTRDTSVTGAGTVGVYASDAATIDNFSASTLALPTPSDVSLPFSDSFTRSDNTITLGSNWTLQTGDDAVRGDQLVGMTDGVSVETVNGISTADAVVSADVDVTSGQSIGLVSRYSAGGGGSYYLGRIGPDGAAEIWSVVDGDATLLITAANTTTSGTLRFESNGTLLQLFLNDQLLAQTTDSTITAAGAVGIYANRDATSGYQDATLDNFLAQAPGSVTNVWLALASNNGPDVQYWNPGVALEKVQSGNFTGGAQQELAGYDPATGNWLVGIPTGSGFTTQVWGNWSSSADWVDVQVGDFNGDGRTDIAARNASTGEWQVATSTGTAFTSSTWGSWSSSVSWIGVHAADLNGDGRTDLVGMDPATGNWEVALSTGTGFTSQQWGSWGSTVTWQNIQVGDFDGDGRADVAAYDPSTGEWHVGITTGNSFGNSVWATWDSSTTWVDVHAADFNGDGKMDLIGRAAGSTDWQVALSDGTGFDTTTWSGAAANLVDVQVADINGDGRADLIGRVDGTREWRVALSTGTGFTDQYWQTYSSALDPLGEVVGNITALQSKAAADLQWVYNHVQYTPYAGEMKGAEATKETLAGNDWDQDALLISMLQNDGIQARFDYGQVDVPTAQVELWLGVKDSAAAQNLLSTAGLSPTVVDSGEPDESIEFDHAWVQAYLPGPSGLQWTNLDPSFKFRNYQAGVSGLSTSVPFDTSGYLAHITTSSPLEYYQDQVAGYLASSDPTQSLADVPYGGPIIPKSFTTLTGDLPYTVVGTPTTSATVPSIMTDRVEIQLQDVVWGGVWEVPIDQTFSVPDIALDTLAITYAAVPGKTNWFYPQLTLNGVVVQQGSDPMIVGGDTMRLVINHYAAGSSSITQTSTYDRDPGITMAIGLDAAQYSQASIAALQTQLNTESLAVENGDTTQTTAAFDDGLQLGLEEYFVQADDASNQIAGLNQLVYLHGGVGDGILDSDSSQIANNWSAAAPVSSLNSGFDLQGAIPGGFLATNGTDGQHDDRAAALQLSGYEGSSLESSILGTVFNEQGLSAVWAIQWANDNGVPVLTIDSSNESTMVSELTLTSSQITTVEGFVADGDTVTIPANEIHLGSWSGTAMMIQKVTDTSFFQGDAVIGNYVSHGSVALYYLFDLAVFPYPIPNPFPPPFPAQQNNGDPVNMASGAFTRSDTDVSIPNIGIPLDFARSYASTSRVDIGWGQGWTDTYGDTMAVQTNGDVIWTDSSGSVYTFTPKTGGGYNDPAGIFGTLTSGTDGFVYTDTHGNSRSFNSSGRLIQIGDNNGNTLNIAYDSEGNLASVTDGADSTRELTFASEDGHITSVSDFTGRTWTFTYDTATDPTTDATIYLLATRTTPSDDSTPAQTLTYSYALTGALTGLMNSITDSTDGKSIQVGYYPDGRAFSVTDPDGNTEHFYYDQMRDEATYVNALGQPQIDELNSQGLTVKQINPDQTQVTSVWSNGMLASQTDAMGRTETFTYDTKGNLTQFVSGDGIETDTTYDATLNRPTEVTVAGVSTSHYTYDSHGNVLSATDAMGDESTMTYSSDGLLESITEPKGNVSSPDGDYTTDYTYNDAGQPLTVTTGLPSTITNTYDSAGDLTSTENADDHTTSYEYDLLGRLLQTTGPDPDGSGPLSAAVSTTSYDLADDLTTTTDPLGNATETFTDGNNRVTTVVNSDGSTSTNKYDAVGNLIASTDSRGATTEYFYDAENRLVFTLLPDGATVSTAYNADGQVESSTDANGNTTTNAYDANGRLTNQTNPAGQTTSFTYDAMGNIATQTDPTGTTTFTRDLLGRITQTRAPGDVITTTDYDPDGNITNQTIYDVSGLDTIPDDPRTLSSDRKRSTTTAYDVLDRPVEVTDPADNHSYTTYDAAGLVTSTTDAAGATTTDSYDDAGRLITQTGPDPDGSGPETAPVTHFTYDADNNLITETDPLSQTTTSAYNDMNELVSVTQPDPDGSGPETAPVTNYTYDTDGRQVAVADADGNTTFTTYDSVGRQLTKVNALGAKWTYSYDPSGNLISTTDADGRTTEYTYNNLNQVTAEKWMDSDGVTVLRTIAYTYNDKNQLETVSDPDSSYAYTYDDAGRVLTIDNDGTPDLPDVTLTQSYDGVGNLASLDANVASTDVFTNSYTSDMLGQMTGVTQSGSGVSDKGATFAYNPLGQFTTVATFASTTTSDPIASSSYGYDDANRLTSLTQTKSSDSSTIAAYGFTYDANGQLTAETNPDGSIAYAYDHDGRLTGASGTGLPASQDYAYDSNNNRTSTTVGSTTNTSIATGGNNQLSTDGTYDYSYDADGNLITRTTISTGATENFAWDYRNRLTDVTYKNSEGTTTQHIHYTYDVFNRRITQEIDSTGSGTYDQVEHYAYDPAGNLLMTLNGSGAVSHVFLNGPASNQVLADDAGSGNVTWMLADQQGSVRDVLDSTGSPIDHIQYDPYGNILNQSSPTDQPRFLYAGMQLDSTGLYFDNARYYDPSTGSFISTDPSGFAGGSGNLYGYVNADSTNLVDPSGLAQVMVGWLYTVRNVDLSTGELQTYVGMTKQDTPIERISNSGHPFRDTLTSSSSTITGEPIYADISAPAGTAAFEGDGLHARLAAERLRADSLTDAGEILSNFDSGLATRANAAAWSAQLDVTTGLPFTYKPATAGPLAPPPGDSPAPPAQNPEATGRPVDEFSASGDGVSQPAAAESTGSSSGFGDALTGLRVAGTVLTGYAIGQDLYSIYEASTDQRAGVIADKSASWAGALSGALIGGELGLDISILTGGLAAPILVPLGSVAGGIAGYYLGNNAIHEFENWIGSFSKSAETPTTSRGDQGSDATSSGLK